MKPQNKLVKERKVAGFFENIFRNFGTIVLGTVLFAMIFLGYFLVNDKVSERKITFAASLGMTINYNSSDAKKVSEDDIIKLIESGDLKEDIFTNISTDQSYSNFISDARVEYSDGVFNIMYFDKDETYATAVVKEIYAAVSKKLMENYDIESIPYADESNPVRFKVTVKNGGFVDRLGIKDFTLLGAVIGFVFSLFIICAFYLLDNTVKNAMDVRRYFDIPVLAVIPPIEDKDEEDM